MTKTKKLTRTLLLRGLTLNKKNKDEKSFLDQVVFAMSPLPQARCLVILLAAGGQGVLDELREYFMSIAPSFTQLGGYSLLTLMAQGLIYPERDNEIGEAWRNVTQPPDLGFGGLLEHLKDVTRQEMNTFAPLLVNILTLLTERPGLLSLEDKSGAEEDLISLLLAAADRERGAVAKFISCKIKERAASWVNQPGGEELTTQLGVFLREREWGTQEGEVFPFPSF